MSKIVKVLKSNFKGLTKQITLTHPHKILIYNICSRFIWMYNKKIKSNNLSSF